MSDKPVYIGDGVYVSFDGFQFELQADTNVIYIEPTVLESFLKYVETKLPIKITIEPTGEVG